MSTVSFNKILENLDGHLRQQLKEYQYKKDAEPSAPVNKPVSKKRRADKSVTESKIEKP